jgi:AcrR family transcriptional regulator
MALRGRILDAAFAAFTTNGYAATTTLEIATRARVSKRELYALVGNKEEMLVACITERARRLHMPADLPSLADRETLARVLASYGARVLTEITDPTVVAGFRLAIAEAARAPEVARALDAVAREARREALRDVMARARAAGLLEGRPDELAAQFADLLMGDVMFGQLLAVAPRPTDREIAARARGAAAAFLQLHPAPANAGRRSNRRASAPSARVSRAPRV